MTAQIDIEPDGVVETVAGNAEMLACRVQDVLDRFKSFIEQRGQETRAWRGDVPRPDQQL